MLQFILGRASSGKTYTATQKISECLTHGKQPVLLVPEQFSFESEKNILDAVGDGLAQKVSVMSFSRICDEIERINGGICGESVTDADKIILINKAIKISSAELKRFKKYIYSSSFARIMLDAVNEFKLNFISAEDLYTAAANTPDEQLALKLSDTALIYENYDAVLCEKFIDNTDRLTKLYYALENHNYFGGKTVFVDSFKGFSGQQYKILERIISQAENVTVTLVDNPSDKRELGVFSNIKKVKNKILNIASKYNVQVLDDIVLNGSNYVNSDLAALEEFMATGKTDFCGQSNNITVCRADGIYAETDFVARNIRSIVRKTGAKYSDFVVAARDTSLYEDALEIACKKNNVSCFIDKRVSLSSMPTATSVMAAVDVSVAFTTENILRFHKSGINILNPDEIATLENYTYLWGIDGKTWATEWKMNPDGFSASDVLSDKAIKKLDAINLLRKKAIEPLAEFKKIFSGTAADMSRALVKLLSECNAAESFKKIAKEYYSSGNTLYNDAVIQSWDSVMQILNSLTVCFGEAQITKSEYIEALKTSVNLTTVGVIPQMVDEAIFGAADRIRPSRPKYVFIMGANQGVFPCFEQNNGLFINSEREKMIDLGLEIQDKTYAAAIDEECLLYSNVCCASHGVFISYSTVSDSGAAIEPSSFVGEIQNRFNCKTVTEPCNLSDDCLPETYDGAYSMLCSSVSENVSNTATLITALGDDDTSSKIEKLTSYGELNTQSINKNSALQLFGQKVMMSPSKFDTFNRCRFMFFCRYGLGVKRLQPAEFNAMQRGTIVHYVLQRSVEDYSKSLAELNKNQISDLVEKYTDEYLAMVSGYGDIETPYLKYLVSTIKRSLKYVVARLGKEFAQSKFEPVKCELKIGRNADIPEIEIPIENGGSIELNGIVDRLDTYNGYIRIVDYKTGHRDFKLPDILFGQNMQMLIYLYAVTKSDKFGGKPAGILYMPASRDKDGSKTERRMNGLLTAESDVIIAMDKENSGEFVPRFSEKSPSDSFIEQSDFEQIFKFIDSKLKQTGELIYDGDISADPIDGLDSGACKYCEYQSICGISDKKHKTVPRITNLEVMQEIRKQVN